MKCVTNLLAVVSGSFLMTSGIAWADFPAFEDRVLGEGFVVGDTFVTEGVTCKVSEFYLPFRSACHGWSCFHWKHA